MMLSQSLALARAPCGRSRRARVRAAAAAEPVSLLPTFYDPAVASSWHFVLANADFMLNDENNEHLPELLRERRRFFLEHDAPVNFFVVTQPAWLDGLPELAKRVRTPAVAIVSPDETWIRCAARARAAGRHGRLRGARLRRRGAAHRRRAAVVACAPGVSAEQHARCARARAAAAHARARTARFVKLRMDRVLIGELSGGLADVTASKGPAPVFPKPASWAAPYNKYAPGWWDMFSSK